MSNTTPIPARLEAVQVELETIAKEVRAANDGARQENPHLRETVSATSAAIAAVQRAHRHAAQAWPSGGEQR